jgi:antiviral helicase SKI2
MNDAIAQLGDLANEWAKNNHVPEVDWARVRSLEFQELLNKRNTLFRRLESSACVLCEEFDQHVCTSTILNASESHIYV